MLAIPGLRTSEGVAHDALHAITCVDADLGGDLRGRTDAQRATVADVRSLGAFTHDNEVNAVRSNPLNRQGALHSGIESHRAQVDVLVKGESQLEQQAPLKDPAGNARVTHSAEQDRVMSADLGQH